MGFPSEEYFDEKLGIWFQEIQMLARLQIFLSTNLQMLVAIFFGKEVCFKLKDEAICDKAQINWTNFGEELLFMEESRDKELK